MTMLFHLSGTPEGVAQTLFPGLGLSVQPVAGTLLTWLNVGTDGPRPEAVHAVDALPAESGSRLVLQVPVQLHPAGKPTSCHRTAHASHVGRGGYGCPFCTGRCEKASSVGRELLFASVLTPTARGAASLSLDSGLQCFEVLNDPKQICWTRSMFTRPCGRDWRYSKISNCTSVEFPPCERTTGDRPGDWGDCGKSGRGTAQSIVNACVPSNVPPYLNGEFDCSVQYTTLKPACCDTDDTCVLKDRRWD